MRYSAQRYGTWEWLHYELPFETDGPEWALSTYGEMHAVVAPSQGLQRGEDGRPILEEWGTIIHAETGEGKVTRRWTGIVVRSELIGKDWSVTIREFPGYLDGMPIETLIRGINADPATLISRVWQDVQNMPNSWLNVSVKGTTSVRVGTNSDDLAAAARATMDGRKQTLDSFDKDKKKKTEELLDSTSTLADELKQARAQVTAAQATLTQLIKDKAPSSQIEAARLVVVAQQAALKALETAYKSETNAKKSALGDAKKKREDAQKAYDSARKAYDKAKDKAREDGGAYEIRPEDTPDAHNTITNICTDTEVEWTTSTTYSEAEPKLSVNIHHPFAGKRRDDLVFEQGVNIITELQVVRDGEEYANAAIGIGAGEGLSAVRASIPSTSKRMRRVATIEDREKKKSNQLIALMRKDLKKKSGKPYVLQIEVVDHELAPMFSWNVGDHILVQGRVPHYGNYSVLHRIVSWQMISETKAILHLKLSSSF